MASARRLDLQGLRAIAVALVIVYHLWPRALPGGFVGVDVFFVLSGFLITGHLHRELRETGTVRLRAFWARRVRRLLPAASVVLIACFALMLALVPLSMWQRTISEIAASALHVQNWALFAGAVDYLGAENDPTLVQHFWSLSVEEQFYLVWPVLLLLAARWPRVALGGVLVASFAYSVLAGGGAHYFDTGVRAWEFAAGGLLAVAAPILRGWVGEAASWLGYGAIVAAAVLFSGATSFPGYAALLPVVGTLLVIAGSNRLASARPLVFLGDHSYALYLWHWPLIVVAPYVIDGEAGPLVIALSLLLAMLTKRFVEDRTRLLPPRVPLVAGALAVTLLVAASTVTGVSLGASNAATARQALVDFRTDPCYGAAALVEPGCESPFEAPAGLRSAFAPVDKGSLGQPCDATDAELVVCSYGDTTSPDHTVALIGNSHAGHLVAALEAYGEDNGWQVDLMRKTGCTGVSLAPLTRETDAECADWTQDVVDRVLGDPDIDIVVVATNNGSSEYLAERPVTTEEADQLREAIGETLAGFVASGRTVVAIGDVPATDQPAPACVDQNHLQYDPCATPRADGEEHGNLVAEAARATDGVGFVDMLPWFCDEELCHVAIGGVVTYIDEHHLSASYSRSLAPYLGAAIEEHRRSSP